METSTPLRHEAALVLCPDSLARGLDALDAIVTKALRKVFYVKRGIEIALMGATAVAAFSGAILHFTDGDPNPWARPWFEYIAALCSFGFGVVAWQQLQHHDIGKKLFDPSQHIPEPLRNLISAYAIGERSAETKTGTETVPRELFRSHWAILLFSWNREFRGWVRSATGQREQNGLYVADFASTQKALAAIVQRPSTAHTVDSQSIRWAKPGWLKDGNCNTLIDQILASAQGSMHFKMQNVLPFMATYLAESRRSRILRADCIRATSNAFNAAQGYRSDTLEKIYDGTYPPIAAILHDHNSERV
jgi:hypothetical protein